MALVIDGSSPAISITTQTVSANTCSAFTPPDSPLLMVLWAADSQTGVNPTAPTFASSPSFSWTQDGFNSTDTPSGAPGGIDGQASIWHAVVTGTPGSTTVSVTNNVASGFRDAASQVLVFTGHDPVAPVGAKDTGRVSGGTSLSDSYTGTIDGGQGLMVICDWSGQLTTTWVAATGCTILNKGTTFGISYATIQRTTPDGTLGGTTTMGLTGLLPGGLYHWVIAEVISLEAALARNAFTSGGWTAAPAQASTW